jgi:hypothetical protein
MKRWDDGKALLVSGDAAGVVAPASGEGIYYAMLCGRLSADAIKEFLVTGKASTLRAPRKRFMKLHGRTFFALGLLQYFWYHSDKRREQFVEMCKDEDVQTLTWQAYTQKKLVKKKKKEHLRVFIKDVAQLLGLSKTACLIAAMTALLQSGSLIAIIVALIVVEAVALYRRHRTTGNKVSVAVFLPNLLAGLFLMCGIQLAVWDAPATALLGCLTMAGLCHLFEFRPVLARALKHPRTDTTRRAASPPVRAFGSGLLGAGTTVISLCQCPPAVTDA